jgi:hypothetical protein
VPIADAPSFKDNFSKLVYSDPDFIIKGDTFVLSKFTLKNTENGKIFYWNSEETSAYALANIQYNFAPIENINVTKNQDEQIRKPNITQMNITVGSSDVDLNIPIDSIHKVNTYALIIGNEDYSTYQPDLNTEVNVDFAKNDASIFKEYCIKTLGIPEKQVIFATNATATIMNQKLAKINLLAKNENGNAELIFYYAGHGLPDEQTKEPYLIPVDVSGSDVQSGIKLQTVYDKLTEFPSKKVTVFIDACFSGGARNQGLLAQRSIKIKPQSITLKGNLVVFTSSSSDESSGAYKDKQHGYFTYFLLKKLQDTKGDVTFKDLSDYLKLNVNKESILNGKPQTPDILFSTDIKDAWENLKLK